LICLVQLIRFKSFMTLAFAIVHRQKEAQDLYRICREDTHSASKMMVHSNNINSFPLKETMIQKVKQRAITRLILIEFLSLSLPVDNSKCQSHKWLKTNKLNQINQSTFTIMPNQSLIWFTKILIWSNKFKISHFRQLMRKE
jgi:hypothetical protein